MCINIYITTKENILFMNNISNIWKVCQVRAENGTGIYFLLYDVPIAGMDDHLVNEEFRWRKYQFHKYNNRENNQLSFLNHVDENTNDLCNDNTKNNDKKQFP